MLVLILPEKGFSVSCGLGSRAGVAGRRVNHWLGSLGEEIQGDKVNEAGHRATGGLCRIIYIRAFGRCSFPPLLDDYIRRSSFFSSFIVHTQIAMATVVHVFDPIRHTLPPPAPSDPANRPRRTQGLSIETRTGFQGFYRHDAMRESAAI